MKEKHLFKLASLLIAMLMGLAMVVSCSKDDGDDNEKVPDELKGIVGSWYSVQVKNTSYAGKFSNIRVMTLNADNTGTFTWAQYFYDKNQLQYVEQFTGRYYYNKESGYLRFKDSEYGEFYIYEVSTNTISYEFIKGERETFTRGTYNWSEVSGGESGGNSSGGGTTKTATCLSCRGSGECQMGGLGCNGTGKCGTCKGKGYVGSSSFNVKCYTCNGDRTCKYCKGTGVCTTCNGTGYSEVTVSPNNNDGDSSDDYISIKAVKIIAVTLNGSDWSYSGSTVNMYKKTSDGKVRLYSNAKRLIGTASSNSDSKCGDTNVRGYTYRVLDIDDLSSKTYYYFN